VSATDAAVHNFTEYADEMKKDAKEIYSPALASLTAHSPVDTLFLSPAGPILLVIAVGFPVFFTTSATHSASSPYSKN